MRLDEAYANAAYIPDGERYYARWDHAAAQFRACACLYERAVVYGAAARETYEIYHPQRSAKGTVIFVHGGYWMAGAASMFSHLAAGSVAAGYACAVPNYTLAPDAGIGQISRALGRAVAAIVQRTRGPLYLVGHSAGGHVVARLGCADLMGAWGARVARIMPVSPLGDLRPLLETSMNATLGLDAKEAWTESPVAHPAPSCPVHIWVGAQERPAFLDQARGLRDAWGCDLTVEAERHHFDVIDGLQDPRSPMMQSLIS